MKATTVNDTRILIDLRYNHLILLPADLATQVMLHGEIAKHGDYNSDTGQHMIELVDKSVEARAVRHEEYTAAVVRMKLRGEGDANT